MDLLNYYQNALALAGTVAIPSPYPASGALYVVWTTDQEDQEVGFLKLVQIVNETEFRAWIFEPQSIGAMRYRRRKENDHEDVVFGPWTLVSGSQARLLLSAVKPSPDDHGAPVGEQRWFEQAIVYLPEAAPVITRHEFATTAAERVECDGLRCNPSCNPCCHAPPERC